MRDVDDYLPYIVWGYNCIDRKSTTGTLKDPPLLEVTSALRVGDLCHIGTAIFLKEIEGTQTHIFGFGRCIRTLWCNFYLPVLRIWHLNES